MFQPSEVYCVFGQRGCGKTFLAQKIHSMYPRKIIFDVLDEYNHGEFYYNFNSFSERLVNATNEKHFTIIYKFDLDNTDFTEEFNQCVRIVFQYGKITGNNVCLVVEELQLFASCHNMPHWFRNVLLLGRHANLSTVMSTQRPAECHKSCISQATHVFCGRLFEPNDIDYCRAVFGNKAFELSGLANRRFLHYRLGFNTVEVSNDLN